MKINIFTERYCHKCHKVKSVQSFLKKLFMFKHSGVCNECIKRN